MLLSQGYYLQHSWRNFSEMSLANRLYSISSVHQNIFKHAWTLYCSCLWTYHIWIIFSIKLHTIYNRIIYIWKLYRGTNFAWRILRRAGKSSNKKMFTKKACTFRYSLKDMCNFAKWCKQRITGIHYMNKNTEPKNTWHSQESKNETKGIIQL